MYKGKVRVGDHLRVQASFSEISGHTHATAFNLTIQGFVGATNNDELQFPDKHQSMKKGEGRPSLSVDFTVPDIEYFRPLHIHIAANGTGNEPEGDIGAFDMPAASTFNIHIELEVVRDSESNTNTSETESVNPFNEDDVLPTSEDDTGSHVVIDDTAHGFEGEWPWT